MSTEGEKRFFRFWGAMMIFSSLFGIIIGGGGAITLGALVWCCIGLWLIVRK